MPRAKASARKRTPTEAVRIARQRLQVVGDPLGSRSRPRSRLLADPTPGGIRARYIEATRLGLKLRDCAAFAGVSASMVRQWRALARDDHTAGQSSEYTIFAEDCEKARAEHVAECLGTINRAAKHNWRAAAHLLKLAGYRLECFTCPNRRGIEDY